MRKLTLAMVMAAISSPVLAQPNPFTANPGTTEQFAIAEGRARAAGDLAYHDYMRQHAHVQHSRPAKSHQTGCRRGESLTFSKVCQR